MHSDDKPLRRGVRVGIDVGQARIGLAQSDRDGVLATPVETVSRVQKAPKGGESADVRRIADLAVNLDAIEIVIGLPISLSGASTESTRDARAFASRVARMTPHIPVRLVDERLSTVTAQSALRTSGKRSKGSRPVIDQIAAVIILQHTLDSEKLSGVPVGFLLDPHEGP